MAIKQEPAYQRGTGTYLAVVVTLLLVAAVIQAQFGPDADSRLFPLGIAVLLVPLVPWLLTIAVRGRYVPLLYATLMSSYTYSWFFFGDIESLPIAGLLAALLHVPMALLAGWGAVRLLRTLKSSTVAPSPSTSRARTITAYLLAAIVFGSLASIVFSGQLGMASAERTFFDEHRVRFEAAVLYVEESADWAEIISVSHVRLPEGLSDLSDEGQVRVRGGVPRIEFLRSSDLLRTRRVIVHIPEEYLNTELLAKQYDAIEVLDNRWILAKER